MSIFRAALCSASVVFLLIPSVFADTDSHKPKMRISPNGEARAGQATSMSILLMDGDTGTPITADQLSVTHTKKFHLLVIDPSLDDYHHIHPTVGSIPGEYVFSYTPKHDGPYRFWADIQPKGQPHRYVSVDIGDWKKGVVNTAQTYESVSGDYRFILTFNTPLVAQKTSIATVKVLKNNALFTQLEPVMGAFAHGVGFTESADDIIHVHPMGMEPKSDAERGGPELLFHIAPKEAGFIKFYVQIRVGGKDIFASFGLYAPKEDALKGTGAR